jgi:endonuclease/exonuclease/phosphatase (EEP) superfamily protein YafD
VTCKSGRVRAALAWLLAGALLAWTVLRLLGLERGWPLVPMVAFTPYVAVLAVLVAVVAGALRVWRATILAAVCAIALVAVVLPRGLADTAPPDAPGVRLRVLTVNVSAGGRAARDIVATVRRERVDLLSVQELSPAAARGFAAAGLDRVMPAQVADVRDGPDGTGAFARAPLRRLDGPSETRFATVMAEARLPGGPVVQLVGLHAQAPTGRAPTRNWRRDLRAQPPAPKSGPFRILAGDFNATLDHAELRRLIGTGYRDAADDAGAGLHATYPSGRRFPPGIAIDHVLVDRRVRVRSARVIALPGTNHRAVLAELVLP